MNLATSRNSIKLRFHRKKRLSQSRSREFLENKTNAEQTKTSSVVWKDEYLRNKNLSIMTDTQLESEDNVHLRQKEHANARTSNSSSSIDSSDYILISSEEIPIKEKDVNWEYVDYDDVAENMRSDCIMKKYCSPKCSTVWFLKIRREILKNCSRKVYPLDVSR